MKEDLGDIEMEEVEKQEEEKEKKKVKTGNKMKGNSLWFYQSLVAILSQPTVSASLAKQAKMSF